MGWVARAAAAIPPLLLILLVARCEMHPGASKLAAADTTAIIEAQERIKLALRDPSSADFTSVHRTARAVCGMVNASNAFGGMTGPRRFIVAATAMVEPSDGDELFDSAWRRQC